MNIQTKENKMAIIPFITIIIIFVAFAVVAHYITKN
jgi:hypothetical protein